MTRVRLEIDEVQIHRRKKNWKLYFVVMAEHPTESDKMILTTALKEPFKLSRIHNNSYQFDTDEASAEGLFVLSREMPADRELNVHIYLRHTTKAVRDLGEVLQEIEEGIGGDAFGIVDDLVGIAATPWLVFAKRAVPMVGRILTKIKDKDFGFLSAFESFGPEFEDTHEIDREKKFTGDASLVYSWSVDD